MVVSQRCPDAAILAALAHGQMPPEEVERLAEHCETCARCLETLAQVRTEDMLIELVRSSAKTVDSPLPELVRKLIPKLQTRCAADASSTGSETSPSAVDFNGARSESDLHQEYLACLTPARMPDELGRLGAYRVLKILGAGGMGVVFLAEEPGLKRLVALKVMKPELSANSSARQRFLREAQAMAAVQHDHIIHINQIDQEGGIPFLAMPFLQGETLEDRLQRADSLSVQEVLRIGREIAEGLSAAHARGLVHRDVKPPNIWLEGAKSRVKILDFGLVRVLSDENPLTQHGAIAGTPAYMAPEQARGAAVDARADLFGLGCVLYRMVAGRTPFTGQNPLQILRAVDQGLPRPVEELRPELPSELCALIMQLLAKNPQQRPESADVVVQALDELSEKLRHQADTPPDSQRHSSGPAATGWPVRIGQFAVLMAIMVPVAGWMLPSVIRFMTNRGELIIETDAPDIEVTIRGDQAIVHDKTRDRRFILTAGDYEVEVREEGEGGIRVATKQFTLTRGGRETIQVRLAPTGREPVATEPNRSPPADDLALWQGNWRCVATTMNDKQFSEEELSRAGFAQVVNGTWRQTTIRMPDGRTGRWSGEFRIDPHTHPKQFDSDNFNSDVGFGPFRLSGIYEIENDRLRMIWRQGTAGQPVERATWDDIGKPGTRYHEYVRDP